MGWEQHQRGGGLCHACHLVRVSGSKWVRGCFPTDQEGAGGPGTGHTSQPVSSSSGLCVAMKAARPAGPPFSPGLWTQPSGVRRPTEPDCGVEFLPSVLAEVRLQLTWHLLAFGGWPLVVRGHGDCRGVCIWARGQRVLGWCQGPPVAAALCTPGPQWGAVSVGSWSGTCPLALASGLVLCGQSWSVEVGSLCRGQGGAWAPGGLHILTMDLSHSRSGRQAWPQVSTVKSRGLSLVLMKTWAVPTTRPVWLLRGVHTCTPHALVR